MLGVGWNGTECNDCHDRAENGLDPNRDFPYSQDPDKCMTTITARYVECLGHKLESRATKNIAQSTTSKIQRGVFPCTENARSPCQSRSRAVVFKEHLVIYFHYVLRVLL